MAIRIDSMTDRYKASGTEESFEPGSDGLVLANKQRIISPKEMDELELILLDKLYTKILGDEFPNRTLSVADLKQWHYQWLGNVYEWAGQERSVNLSKGDFAFAAAAQIPKLLGEFEQNCLQRYTPCHGLDGEALARAIAETHVELILIHQFREGNGRLARLLADVMAVQAGYDPLDYSTWEADREGYFAAIRQGLLREYGPMTKLVSDALKY